MGSVCLSSPLLSKFIVMLRAYVRFAFISHAPSAAVRLVFAISLSPKLCYINVILTYPTDMLGLH